MIGNLNLTDRCDIWQPVTSAGAYNDRRRQYQPHVSDVPFRFIEKSKQGRDGITGEFVVTAVAYGQFPIDTAIEEGDQVRNIVLHGGETVAGVYQVKGGADRKRGRTIRVKRVSLQKVS